jgi:hypothetical protein
VSPAGGSAQACSCSDSGVGPHRAFFMDISTAVAFIIGGLLVSRHNALRHTCLALRRACNCICTPVGYDIVRTVILSSKSTTLLTPTVPSGHQLLRQLADPMEVQTHTRPSTQFSDGQCEDHQTERGLQSSPGLVSPVWRHL